MTNSGRALATSLREKLSSPAFRRDPLRMFVRPILRRLELRMLGDTAEAWRTRDLGNGAAVAYRLQELLDRSRYLYGMHEYMASSVFVAHIAAGSLVIDVGANIGEYSMLAARTTREKGHVIAYEPNPGACARLERNVALNHLSNVEISPHALGSEDAEAVLRVPHDESGLGTLRVGAFGSEYRVEVRRLDGLMSHRDVSRLSVLKVDVEGLELQVFEGAERTIAAARPMIFYECAADAFEERRGRFVTPAMQFLEDAGYDNFVVTMTRSSKWTLWPLSRNDDPRKYREPWEVLVVVARPHEKVTDTPLSGASPLRPCGLFELLGR